MPMFTRNQACRAIRFEGDADDIRRHHALMIEFAERDVPDVRGSSSLPVDGRPGRFVLSAFLDESVADEYVRRMGGDAGQTAPPAGMPTADVADAMDRAWRDIVSLPWPQVCRHLAAGMVIAEMEALGISPPRRIVDAIASADDATALAWDRNAADSRHVDGDATT